MVRFMVQKPMVTQMKGNTLYLSMFLTLIFNFMLFIIIQQVIDIDVEIQFAFLEAIIVTLVVFYFPRIRIVRR